MRKKSARIGFITSSEMAPFAPDDSYLCAAFEERGAQVLPVVWDDPTNDVASFDALVFRSCWDYCYKPQDFAAWVNRLKEIRARTFNALNIVTWNLNKTYLKDFSAIAVPTVPTEWLHPENRHSIRDILEERRWDRAVIKPTISATALHTWVTSVGSSQPDQQRLDDLLASREMLLQEYLPEIQTAGEWSLIFIAGKFSHAVRKVPRSGDFRVQTEFGGTWETEDPSPHVIAQATRALKVVPDNLLYVRLDGVERNGEFLLMEFEAIEPTLFFAARPQSAHEFADALVSRL